MHGIENLNVLAHRLSPGSLLTDPDLLESYRQDWSFDPDSGTPAAVVRAADRAEVEEVLRFANEYGIPVVPRGSGTSVVGGSTAIDGAITLSLERMTAINVDPASRTAVVEPGALTVDVKLAAAAAGLFYPPDPSSYEICSIGGNVATNAGGPCCAKYGVTSDYVLGMTVVLADGSAVELGGARVKDSPGLALAKLFVGSEGTLGVITSITLRLVPHPSPAHTLVAYFPHMREAAAASHDIAVALRPSQLEIMDNAAVNVAEDFLRMDLDRTAGALLIACSDAGAAAESEVARMEKICEKLNSTAVFKTDDRFEGELFDRPRHAIYEALEKAGVVISDDVAVPNRHLSALTEGLAAIAERNRTTIVSCTHAADELTHPVLSYPHGNESAAVAAAVARREVHELVAALGGTISTEYGIGRQKRAALAASVAPELLSLHRRIKQAIDPSNILNPDVLIP
ncbi:FAD-binding oxidoreductase [Rhodococcus sp. ABRD24]|uniref:FAD-binding oxidoreductase n=1 Tax=Rhodococcus sp. ABRD24 TaxID=2507582 RepID=UPI00103C392E|nr:FAD-binding oxidoreductase [Rhodococcus sp. ABRD24]QBJ96734.1 FAD-binding oxidoreductase [Rhodococcus sp. ABRD24]